MNRCHWAQKSISFFAAFLLFSGCLMPRAFASDEVFTYRVDCLPNGSSCTFGVFNPSFDQANPPRVSGRSPQRVQSHSSACSSCWLLTYNFSTSPVSFSSGVPLPYGGSLGGNVQQLDLSPNLVSFLQHLLYAGMFHAVGIGLCLMFKP